MYSSAVRPVRVSSRQSARRLRPASNSPSEMLVLPTSTANSKAPSTVMVGLRVTCGSMSVPRQRRRSLVTLGFLAAFAVAAFSAVWLLDYFVIDANQAGRRDGPFAQLFDFDAETMQNALGSLSQVIAAVLGIAITVVSIVVQLAATRYTSRVADLFFRDRINLGVMGFFVVACVEALWVSFTVRRDYVPQATITATVIMASGSLLVLVPYFAYVFDFLDPEKVIARIGQQTLERATSRKRTHVDGQPDDTTLRQDQTVSGLAHLADIAVNALGQKDKVIATDASAALRRVLVEYQGAQGDARRRVVRDRRAAAHRSGLRRAGGRFAGRPGQPAHVAGVEGAAPDPRGVRRRADDDARDGARRRHRHALRRRGGAGRRRPRGADPDGQVHEHLPARCRSTRATCAPRTTCSINIASSPSRCSRRAPRGRRRRWSRSPSTSSTTPAWRTASAWRS